MAPTNDISEKLQTLVQDSLTRICASEQLERLRRFPRPSDASAAHATLSTALMDTYAGHLAAIHDIFVGFARSVNSVAPVNQLPPDILITVFADVPLSDRIITSQVCSYWRSTALESALLWRHIRTTTGPGRTTCLAELLARSKDALVALELSSEGVMPDLIAANQVLLSHMHHMKSLSLVLNFDWDDGKFDRVLDLTASPVLTHLAIRPGYWYDRFDLEFSHEIGAYCALQSLHLFGVRNMLRSDCNWPHFPRLRDLHLQLLDSTIPFGALKVALGECPELQQLVLSDLPDSEDSDTGHTWHLSELRNVGLAGEDVPLVVFESVLTFLSPSPVRNVSFYSKMSSGDISAPLFHELQNVIRVDATEYERADVNYAPRDNYNEGSPTISIRAEDERGLTRTMYAVRDLDFVFATYHSTLQTLHVDVAVWEWFFLCETLVLPALEELKIFGAPFYARTDAPVVVPALKYVTVDVCVHGLSPDIWSPADVRGFFLERDIQGYTKPLQRLTLRGGIRDTDWEVLNGSTAEDALRECATTVNISYSDVGTAQVVDVRKSWIPSPSWARFAA